MAVLRALSVVCLLLCVHLSLDAFAGMYASDSLQVYQLRMPEKSFFQEFREDPAFFYDRPDSAPDWWKKFLDWLESHLSRPDYDWEADSRWLNGVAVVLCVVLLIWCIYRLVRHKFLFVPSGSHSMEEAMNAAVGERLDTESYPSLVEQAEMKQDYVLAIRIHYWYLLWLLDREGLIRWQSNRTNLSYCDDLKDSGLQPSFRHLTTVFEHVCYGEFEVKEELYRKLRTDFERFRERLSVTFSKHVK